ncbi:hypothetical protein F5883DRAFT_539733 [Diaporthe sp. PMI_573]|nr:hypothetical protein F5883DRAFT_539733 [Diaporthaceae sp. PMI_573]
MSTFRYTIPIRDRADFLFLRSIFGTIWNSVAPLRLLGSWNRSHTPPSQPHGFTSKAFVANGVVQPIPAPYFSQPFQSWRLISVFQLAATCLWYIGVFSIVYRQWMMILILDLEIRLVSFCLRQAAIINEPFSLGSIYRILKTHIATVTLRIVSRMDQAFPIFSLWSLFWSIYFITSVRRKRFTQNYIEAWRQNYPDYAIPVFFDRSSCLRIPCPDPNDPALDDAWIWSHLSFFYRISRIEGGIAPVLLPKSLSRLETVEIKDGSVPGAVISTLYVPPTTCALVEDFAPVKTSVGQRSLIWELVQSDVYQETGSTNTPNALKFVVGWDASMISNIILLPTLLSIAATVAWPMVAVLRYGEGVQISVQTGTAVGGYIITAGALVVGLVTLFDALAK